MLSQSEIHHIILAQILAILYLNDNQRYTAGIFQAMLCSNRNICTFIFPEHGCLIIDGQPACSLQDSPVDTAMVMQLLVQLAARIDNQLLHLVAVIGGQNCIAAPRTVGGDIFLQYSTFLILQLVYNFLDLLAVSPFTNHQDVRRISNNQVADTHSADQAMIADNQVVLGLRANPITDDAVAIPLLNGFRNGIKIPTSFQ